MLRSTPLLACLWLASLPRWAAALARRQAQREEGTHHLQRLSGAVDGAMGVQLASSSTLTSGSPEDDVFSRKPFTFPLNVGQHRFVAAAEMTISLPWPYPRLRAYNVALYIDHGSALWGRSNGLNEMLSEMPGEVTIVYNLTGAFLDNQRFAASCPPMATFMSNVSWATQALSSLQSRYENGPKFHEGSVILLHLSKSGVHVWMDGEDAGIVEVPGPELSQAILESTYQIPQFHDAVYWSLLAGQPTEVAAPVLAEVHVTVPWYAIVFPTLAVIVSLWCCWRRCVSCLGVCFAKKR